MTVEIVFPEAAAEQLHIPPVDLLIGATNSPVEVPVRCSGWTLRRRPVVRLVLIDFAARDARRWKVLAPVLFVANAIVVPLAVVAAFLDRVPWAGGGSTGAVVVQLVAFMLVSGSLLVRKHRRPDAYPMLVTGRRVLMAGVPRRVATEWVAQNPGVVRICDEPVAPRGFRRWVYAVTAVPLVMLALALIGTIAVQGRSDYYLPTMTAFGLFAAAVVLIAMSLPTRRR